MSAGSSSSRGDDLAAQARRVALEHRRACARASSRARARPPLARGIDTARTARPPRARACRRARACLSCTVGMRDLERRVRRALAVLRVRRRRARGRRDPARSRRRSPASSGRQPRERGQRVEREMQLGRHALACGNGARDARTRFRGGARRAARAACAAGSAFETTVPAASFSPLSSSTPETRSPSSVMRATGLPSADRGAGGARGGWRAPR